MESTFPLLFAVVVGIGHAFEADHLIAVSSIVTRRNKLMLAVKDGIYWGLGHTSTIVVIGLLMIVGKYALSESIFSGFEAVVGLMLIGLGLYRLWKLRDTADSSDANPHHHVAYQVGLVHGLAGSGALVLLVMTEIEGSFLSMMYLLLFGLGSVMGMLLAAGLFSLPIHREWSKKFPLKSALGMLSAVFCIGYGSWVFYENIMS